MRLIDADELIKRINGTGYHEQIKSNLLFIAKRQPTIDAVEVVRCKDCKHFTLNFVENVDGVPLIVAHEICSFWGDGCKTSQEGFCSFGERKEE